MADFIVRVELRGGDSEDYDLLHEKMNANGYLKEITHSSGIKYKLPTSEYIVTKNKTASQIRDEVKDIASSVKNNPGVLVTKSDAMAWSLTKI
ncbi:MULTISPECIES: type V toxin-antitoxin system endoribonuclease antitoxin GhoS [Yersinia]|uniref:Phage protein n=1 Tax=Yersinia pekkanenii TaxID=1288385 RepID=A0A0T9RQQ0_9GAMM|nr:MULTISPECIES: type V toxin-antitoxin system endoribonuclease antitoxin GhoS [Yersinia]AYX14010.1 endoribonuclease GhoS [Yersinia pseudotuberculosis]CNI75477.1 phage protein [Yersinia pekkanenii]CRY69741.1 phage protein [Yersinia pekkanenii]SUQ17632.1 phage protein [Yersinia pseudotuberculosis]